MSLHSLHSSFWMDDYEDDFSFGEDTQERQGGLNFGDLIKLSQRRRAIANFVSILTGQQIPVHFSSKAGQNYTDGEHVVISADATHETFDSDVGLALHEGSHILLSNFDMLRNILGPSCKIEGSTPILHDTYKASATHDKKLNELLLRFDEKGDLGNIGFSGKGRTNFKKYILGFTKDVWNWVEDRRIDHYVFHTAPGYREYYISLYDQYFRTKEIGKALVSDEHRTESINSYMFRIINLLHENRQLTALKGLPEIVKILDLNNVERLTSSELALECAVAVANVIFDNVDWDAEMDDMKKNSKSGDGESDFEDNDFEGEGESSDSGDGKSSDKENGEKGDSSKSDSESDEEGKGSSSKSGDEEGEGESSGSEGEDGESSSSGSGAGSDTGGSDEGDESDFDSLSKSMKKRVENQFKKQKDFLRGDTKKKKASKKDLSAMKAAEQSGSEIVQVGKDLEVNKSTGKLQNPIDCIMVKNLTQSLIESSEFPMKNKYNKRFSEESVMNGIRLGTVLGKRLKIRSEVRELKYLRQRSGRIEKRLINELGYGMENVFGHVEVSKYKNAILYISIDASSSMFSGSYQKRDSKWHRTITAAVAMAKGASMIDNLDVRIDFRTTQGNFPYILIAYDSTKDAFAKVKNLFPFLSPGGYTPEGLCFEALAKTFAPATTERDVYFVNISDGQPYFHTKGVNGFYYGGHLAHEHVRKQVEALRKKGITVSSYFVGDAKEGFNAENNMKSFRRMYGKDAQFINVSNIFEIAKVMNKKFLAKASY